MSKSSRRARAAQKQAVPAAEDFIHSAADQVGPMAHNAADRLAPLAQSAADRVGPLAEAAADRIGAAADKVSPLAHTAADRLGPLAHNAADRVGPLVHTAADRVAPAAQSAVDRIGPLATQAVERVSPYARQAADRVSPYTHTAAERIVPIAATAKVLGSQVAHDAMDKINPALGTARERVGPAVDVARERVSDNLLPRLTGALSAAAASPVAVEAAKRGQATLAAAKGELQLPEPPATKKKGRWVKRVAIVAAVAAVAVVAFRKFFGNKDADWQAARPSTPYAPPSTPTPPTPTDVPEAVAPEATAAEESLVDAGGEAGDDPQAGQTAHSENIEANGEPVPDQPAEGGEPGADGYADVAELSDASTEDQAPVELGETPAEAYDQPTEVYEQPSETIEYQEPADGAYTEPGGGAEYDRPTEDGEFAQPADGSEGEPSESGPARWSGEGVYVGNEPPEGFVIKGNERSMKYHVPEAAGYGRTVAEVWFNSEEAAQQAGFIRAQR